MCTFNVPQLRVGSLDSLMALSDEVARADGFVEGVVKKVERQVTESYNALKLAELAAAAASAGAEAPTLAAVPALGLRCAGKPVYDFLPGWGWDAATWDTREPLPELLRRMTSAAEKVDADIRAVAAAYQEKKTALVAAERKRRCGAAAGPGGGSLLACRCPAACLPPGR